MDQPVVRLCRMQIGRGDDGVDVTQKSAGPIGRPFAPSWDMVMGHKKGTISDETYRSRYIVHLELLGFGPVRLLWQQGVSDGGVLTLRCYCRDGNFCHTYLLIEWLISRYPNLFTV